MTREALTQCALKIIALTAWRDASGRDQPVWWGHDTYFAEDALLAEAIPILEGLLQQSTRQEINS